MTKDTLHEEPQFNSTKYWRRRYRNGGNSGAGSYGRLADYKAGYINDLVSSQAITSIVEFGCGDGNQASFLNVGKYTGLDISQIAVRLCRRKMAEKTNWTFEVIGRRAVEAHQMAMSLDVIYHLIEDEVFEVYMENLFAAASRFVLIYSSDSHDVANNRHVRHRCFSDWIAENKPHWELIDTPAHPLALGEGDSHKSKSFAAFKLFKRCETA